MIEMFRRKLRSSGFFRGVLVLVGGTAIAQALPTIVTPIVTRIYSPTDIGVLGIFVAFLGVAIPLLSLQYSKAIVSAGNEVEAHTLLQICVLLVPLLSLVLTGILAVLQITSVAGFGDLPLLILPISFVTLVAAGLFATLRYWNLRIGQFRTISIATVWQSVWRSVAQLGLGFLGAGGLGLALSEVVGRGGGLLRLSKGAPIQFGQPIDWQQVKNTLGAFRRFPLLGAPSILINSLALSLPVPLIAHWFTVESSGYYSIAYRVVLFPLAVVGTAVGDVFHNKLAEVAQKSNAHAKMLFLRVSGILGIGGLLLGISIFLVPDSIWTAVLGEEWALAGQIARALIPLVMVQFVVNPVSQVIPVFQRQDLKLVYDITSLVAIVLAVWLGNHLEFGLVSTVLMLSISQAFAYTVFFVTLYFAIPRE